MNGLSPISPSACFHRTSSSLPDVTHVFRLLTICFLSTLLVASVTTYTAFSQTTWTKHPANPVLRAGGQGAWDQLWVMLPSVLYKDSVYVMWYGGDNDALLQTGRATSIDGITWTKDSLNPILAAGPPGAWDQSGAWEAKVVFTGNHYEMWFTGANGRWGPGSTWNVGHATSEDGRLWLKDPLNPVLKEGDAASWEAFYTNSPTVLFDGSTYHMWYESHRGAWSLTAVTGIGHATSPDGVHWTKDEQNPVLAAGPPGSWDELGVGMPHVIFDSGWFHMWYTGNQRLDWGELSGLGYAVSSDGTSWKKYPANPVLVGFEGSWDPKVLMPFVIPRESYFQMWYTGGGGVTGASHSIGYATAPRNRATITPSTNAIDMHNVAPGSTSDTVAFTISNWGFSTLSIASITAKHREFTITGHPAFPVSVPPFQELRIGVAFKPATQGTVVVDSATIVSDDSSHPTSIVALRGRGSGAVVAARIGTMYGIGVSSNTASLFEIDKGGGSVGSITRITPHPPAAVDGFAVRQSDKFLYAARSSLGQTHLYRISSAFGDLESAGTIPLGRVSAIAFDALGALYLADSSGRLYRTSSLASDTVLVATPGVVLTGLASNPVTGMLWGSCHDSLYTLDPATGHVASMGRADFAGRSSLAFGPLGSLYGLFGNVFASIDKSTGVGTMIGELAIPGVCGIGMRSDPPTDLDATENLRPTAWQLSQNYPNPFNPHTTVSYRVPVQAHVKLSISDLLGREVALLANEIKDPGLYSAVFDGTMLASGVYVCCLKSETFAMNRLMVLLR